MKWNLSILCGAALGLAASVAWAIPEEHKFLDRDALTETLTIEDEAALEAAQAELDAAAQELAELEATRDAAQTELDAAEAALEEATQAVDAATADLAAKEQATADAQQALDDAVAMGAPPDQIAQLEAAVADATQAEEQAQQTLTTAQNDQASSQADFDAKQDTFQMAEAAADAQAEVVEEKEQLVALIGEEIERTGEIVEGLSNEQVFALGRNLNSAIKSGLLPLFISADDLQALADGDYSKQQINAFVRKFIQRARFEQHAVRFEAKGDLAKADRMREKGESQFEKFDGKIAKFGDSGLAASQAQSEAKGAAKSAANGAAKDTAKGAAKQAAKQAANEAATEAAQTAAKDSAKSAAKDAAKQAADEAAKEAGRGLAKGKDRNS